MRITNQMLSSSVISNMQASLAREQQLQNQGSSGNRIQKASDDPTGTARALALHAAIDSINQYSSNVASAKSSLSLVDSSLASITTSLDTVKTLTLQGANGIVDPDQQKALAQQVQQQIDSIVGELNSSNAGTHLFSGNQTQQAAIVANPGGTPPYNYNGDDGQQQVQVNDSTTVTVNVTAKTLMNFGGAVDSSSPDTLSVLSAIRDDLNSGNQSDLQTRMKQLDSATQNVITQRGVMGTRGAQMDVYSNRLSDMKLSTSDQLSSVENVDIAQTLTDLQEEQNIYQSSLIVTSKLMQTSLADYLK